MNANGSRWTHIDIDMRGGTMRRLLRKMMPSPSRVTASRSIGAPIKIASDPTAMNTRSVMAKHNDQWLRS